MPYDLSEITPDIFDGVSSWNNRNSSEMLVFKLKQLDEAIVGKVPDNGYWISFIEIMDDDGNWFVPTIQYAFHVIPSDNPFQIEKIYKLLTIKNIYVRNTQGDNEWKLVDRTHGGGGLSRPIPDEDHVNQSSGRFCKPQTSENSHIWTTVNMGAQAFYVVSEWIDMSSFAFRELLLHNIDPEVGELKMLIQVAGDDYNFQAAINRRAI